MRRWLANKIFNHEDLVSVSDMLLQLCWHANDGAFENGVTDPSGWIDQGDYYAVGIMDDARFALRRFGPEEGETDA